MNAPERDTRRTRRITQSERAWRERVKERRWYRLRLSLGLRFALMSFLASQIAFTLASSSPAHPPLAPPSPLLPPQPSPGLPPAAPPPYVMPVGLRVVLTVAIPVALIVLCCGAWLAMFFWWDRPRFRERQRLDAERDATTTTPGDRCVAMPNVGGGETAPMVVPDLGQGIRFAL